MKVITREEVRLGWLGDRGEDWSGWMGEFSESEQDTTAMAVSLGLPDHLMRLARANRMNLKATVSIPFYSLCRGLFLPLSGMNPDKAARLFGLRIPAPPRGAAREELAMRFMELELGLSPMQKTACLLGDPYLGRSAGIRRGSMVRLLGTLSFMTHHQLLDRLAAVGDVAVLFAGTRRELKSEPPLTAGEVLAALAMIPDMGRNDALEMLRRLFQRCGRVEAFFLVRLVLCKSGLGQHTDGSLITRLLAARFEVDEAAVAHAAALTDLFRVTRVLVHSGAAGLRQISLKPLSPIRPCLASPGGAGIDRFPVWVERKYDGIRLMIHRLENRPGEILCAAYSRNRRDYLEQVPGLLPGIRAIQARDVIMDGELHGTVVDLDGPRPATVYEIMSSLNGRIAQGIQLHYAAFDLLYLNGRDLTQQTLEQRRAALGILTAPLSSQPLPIPMSLAEGALVQDRESLNRLYGHFRAQGYEGFVSKAPEAPYRVDHRDTGWRKRKPEITLDLVITGALYALDGRAKGGGFGAYVLGAGNGKGGFEDVGDVNALDMVSDREIQRRILNEGLWTGETIQRGGANGARTGPALRPAIVVTVRFEGVVRDQVSGRLSLRSPAVISIREDKDAHEVDSLERFKALYVQQRLG